jgi:hypothetical protein
MFSSAQSMSGISICLFCGLRASTSSACPADKERRIIVENQVQAPKRDHMDTILKIVKRAQSMGIAQGSQCTQFIDIEKAFDQFDMRLDDWLAADNFNFSHDFCGIQNCMNRRTGKVEGLFLPRFSGR